jgi:uncharacterized membrane protein
MIEFNNSIIIKRSLSEVFDFVSNFENMPKWNYYILEVSKLSNGPVGKGTTFHQIRKRDQQDFQVIKFVPNRLITIETLPPERSLKMRFEFEPTDGGTQIKDIWQMETDVPGPFNWLAARKVKSAVAENLRKLKDLLETGHVITERQ